MFDIKLLATLAFQNIYKHCITVITISFDYNEAFLHRYMINMYKNFYFKKTKHPTIYSRCGFKI